MHRQPRGGGHDDKAHPPIHPTRAAPPASESNWSPPKQKVYEFVVRSFLATCSAPAIGLETNVDVAIANEEFSARGAYEGTRVPNYGVSCQY